MIANVVCMILDAIVISYIVFVARIGKTELLVLCVPILCFITTFLFFVWLLVKFGKFANRTLESLMLILDRD